MTERVKVEVYLPDEALDAVREALHQAGAGRVGQYDHCVSIGEVRGYWRPLEGAHPYLGERGEVMEGRELKLEVLCPAALARDVVQAVRTAHPYEEPVINIIPLVNVDG